MGGGGIMGLFCGLKREKKNEYDDDMDDYKNDSQGDGEEIGGIIDHDNASVVGDKEQEVIGLKIEAGAGVEVGVGVGTGAEKESANHSCYIDDSVKEMVIVVAKALLSKEFGAFRRYKIVAQKGKVNDHVDDDLDDNDNIGVDEYDDDRLDFRIGRVSSSINHQRIRKSLNAKEDESFDDVKKKMDKLEEQQIIYGRCEDGSSMYDSDTSDENDGEIPERVVKNISDTLTK